LVLVLVLVLDRPVLLLPYEYECLVLVRVDVGRLFRIVKSREVQKSLPKQSSVSGVMEVVEVVSVGHKSVSHTSIEVVMSHSDVVSVSVGQMSVSHDFVGNASVIKSEDVVDAQSSQIGSQFDVVCGQSSVVVDTSGDGYVSVGNPQSKLEVEVGRQREYP
jgi:hypothetical protein